MIFSLRVQMLEDKGNCRARRLLPLTGGRPRESAAHADQRNKEDGKIRPSHEEIRTLPAEVDPLNSGGSDLTPVGLHDDTA